MSHVTLAQGAAEGAVCVPNIQVCKEPVIVECDSSGLEELLRTSGFLRVSGHWLSNEGDFPLLDVMVQQVNWTHKPLDLPHLSPQEIMQIYAGLSQVRRNQVIEFLKQRQLRESGLVGESAGSRTNEDEGRQFFAEYAELFHAFRNLAKRMDDAWQKDRVELVDYYLSGRGMDSLPTLLESLYEGEGQLDDVTIYLALLCLIQIYECPTYRERPQVSEQLKECREKLYAIETSGQLQLISDDVGRTKRFFDWYREHFSREYRSVDDEQGHATD